jgi:acetate kinase
VRRYGYAGISFECVIDALPEVDERAAHGKTIIVHVGDGASLCALDGGRKVAMATGFGDHDSLRGTCSRQIVPDVILPLVAELGMGPSQVRTLLRQQPKLLGVCELAHGLDQLVRSNEPGARVAVAFLLYRISRALESLAAALGGLDAIVFTASTSPHAVPIRAGICRRVSWLGLDLDPAANRAGRPRLTRRGSRVTAWLVPTNKRLLVARRTQAVVG